MSEYIGARISLISKSDIRYVGTLIEINSESSTVSLENVTSFGTEGRKNNPAEEIAANSSIYDNIVFRGSEVKDLRIEEAPKENKPPPQVPDDPAILGSSRASNQNQLPSSQQRPPHQPPPFGGPPPYAQFPPYGGQRFGPPGGFLGGPGGPGNQHGFPPYPGPPVPYGAPPGWYPPPGQGFPQHPGPGPQGPLGPPGQHPPNLGPKDTHSEKQELSAEQPKSAHVAGSTASPGPSGSVNKGPPLPVETKPNAPSASALAANKTAATTASTGPKSNRIVPAVPLPGSAAVKAKTMAAVVAQQSSGNTPVGAQQQQSQYNAAAAASAAVAAAMAKLPPQKSVSGPDGSDNLARKVSEMRIDDSIRRGRGQGSGGFVTRGGRGGRGRGGARDFGHGARKVEVPTEDFDFESANAKFNKQDLVKQAIASGSPLGTPDEGGDSLNGDAAHAAETNGSEAESKTNDVVIPPAAQVYNKSTSFFDNLSSDLKEKEDAVTSGRKLGGQEFRREERQKNLETFGQGSVDGHRGGFRGRGGRGFRGRARGGFAPRGRGTNSRGQSTAPSA